MNEYREDNRCYFHPRQVVIGVCASCLHERLAILAEKQGQQKRSKNRSNRGSVSLQKVFALGSLLNRLDVRHQKSDDYNSSAPTSQEDSFISINFEDNGMASWEKSAVPKISLDHGDWNHMKSKNNKMNKQENQGLKSVMEHTKPRSNSLRWRKRIGYLFQLGRWKRSSKGSSSSVCHVGSKLDGVKVRHGWIRTLTKRRTKE